MIKTIIKEDEQLFTVMEVNVFSNREGVRSSTLTKVKVAKLGNSLTWYYSLDSLGHVSFYRMDRNGDLHDESEVVHGCGGRDSIWAGDYVWFKSEGKFSTWGKMIPPRNPARRALWENYYFIPKQSCRFELTPEQYDEVLERWRKDIDRNANSEFKMVDIRHSYSILSDKPVVSVLIKRPWVNKRWRVVELCAAEGMNGDRLYTQTQKLCKAVNFMNNEINPDNYDGDGPTEAVS